MNILTVCWALGPDFGLFEGSDYRFEDCTCDSPKCLLLEALKFGYSSTQVFKYLSI